MTRQEKVPETIQVPWSDFKPAPRRKANTGWSKGLDSHEYEMIKQELYQLRLELHLG